MKIDEDAELERPEQFSLIDTTTDTLNIVDLPASVSYSFRSLARGPQAEALILGTDGRLYVFDPVTGDTIKTVDVTGPWTRPDDWQDPRRPRSAVTTRSMWRIRPPGRFTWSTCRPGRSPRRRRWSRPQRGQRRSRTSPPLSAECGTVVRFGPRAEDVTHQATRDVLKLLQTVIVIG